MYSVKMNKIEKSTFTKKQNTRHLTSNLPESSIENENAPSTVTVFL